MRRLARVVAASLALGACANRCSQNAAFQKTFDATLVDRSDAGAAAILPDQSLSVRVDAGDAAEITFETWSSTCRLQANRDATGALTPTGEPCRIAPGSPTALELLADLDAALAAPRPPEITIALLAGRALPGGLDLDLEVKAGARVQRCHVHGGP